MRRFLRATLRYLISLFLVLLGFVVSVPNVFAGSRLEAVYPTSVCGSLFKSNASWSTARSGNAGSSAGNVAMYVGYNGSSYYVHRGVLTYDLTRFPSDTKFNNVQLCTHHVASAGSYQEAYLVPSTHSTSSLSLSDFSAWTATKYATITGAIANRTVCNDVFNTSTMIGGTWWRLMTIQKSDWDNTPPASGSYYDQQFYCSDATYIYRTNYLRFDIDVPDSVNSTTTQYLFPNMENIEFFTGLLAFGLGFVLMWWIL